MTNQISEPKRKPYMNLIMWKKIDVLSLLLQLQRPLEKASGLIGLPIGSWKGGSCNRKNNK